MVVEEGEILKKLGVCVCTCVCLSIYMANLAQAHLICNEGTSFVLHAKVDSFSLKGHQPTVKLIIKQRGSGSWLWWW